MCLNKYYVYILRCTDNSLYTGITTDIDRRMNEHKYKSKSGAKYTKNHDFKKLEIYFETDNRSNASKLEYAVKKLKKSDKESIIINNNLDVLKEKIDIHIYKIVKNFSYEE